MPEENTEHTSYTRMQVPITAGQRLCRMQSLLDTSTLDWQWESKSKQSIDIVSIALFSQPLHNANADPLNHLQKKYHDKMKTPGINILQGGEVLLFDALWWSDVESILLSILFDLIPEQRKRVHLKPDLAFMVRL